MEVLRRDEKGGKERKRTGRGKGWEEMERWKEGRKGMMK